MKDDKFKILVADDEYWIRENLRSLINWEEHSFEFLEPVEDGEQALEIISKQRPDIVITDVNMPFLSGTELIEKAYGAFPEIVFIALSGYSDYGFVRAALVAGAMDYLLKPISKDDLTNMLARAVDRLLERRASKLEQFTTQEKLRIASSSAADRNLSQLIHRTSNCEINAQTHAQLAEYELEYSGFTLVLFRTSTLYKIIKMRGYTDVEHLVFSVKELIAKHIVPKKHFVFHNTYKTNEFLLITDMDGGRIKQLSQTLVEKLRNEIGSPVTAVISRHYYTFNVLCEAYNEAVLALMSRQYSDRTEVLLVSETQDFAVVKRMNSEHEKKLLFAAASGNRSLFKKVLYEEINLPLCIQDGWRFAEVRQTVDGVSWILRNALNDQSSQVKLLALENLAELLTLAVDGFNMEEMLMILEQMFDEFFDSSGQTHQSDSVKQTVKQVKEYINHNFFEELSLTLLSKQFLIESSYLSKAFKQVVGDNLMLYIAKVRVEKAKEYISKSQLSITEISRLVGYSDYAYFSRVFRKITGASPRDYRKGGEL